MSVVLDFRNIKLYKLQVPMLNDYTSTKQKCQVLIIHAWKLSNHGVRKFFPFELKNRSFLDK